jgi:hypothetical protein
LQSKPQKAQSEVGAVEQPPAPPVIDDHQLRAQNRRSQVQDEIRQMAEKVEEAVNFIESINVKEEERRFKSMQFQKTKEREELGNITPIQE